jgi:hypothetical protein
LRGKLFSILRKCGVFEYFEIDESLRCGSVSESNGSINTKIKKMTGCGDSENVKGSCGYSTSLK